MAILNYTIKMHLYKIIDIYWNSKYWYLGNPFLVNALLMTLVLVLVHWTCDNNLHILPFKVNPGELIRRNIKW